MDKRWVAWAWGFSLVCVWVFVALSLDQSLLQEQLREDLLRFGAVQDGALLEEQPWRLLTAQWLQSHPSRLLFTVVMIALVGGAIAERTSVGAMLFIGLGGGAAGFYVASVGLPDAFGALPGMAVLAEQTIDFPDNVRFGAAQTVMALCGAAVLIFVRVQPIWWVAGAGALLSFGFDLFQGTQGAAQVGFLFGFVVAALLLATGGVRPDGKRNPASRR